MTSTDRGALSWIEIVRLGLVQSALGAVVVLTTSTLNRVMVVELMLPAMLPGALVGLHYAVQLSRPRWGHGSDMGGRRTPWILAGMAVLAGGGVLAAAATALAASAPLWGILLSVLAFVLIGGGVGAAGTSLLALLATDVAPERRAPAASITWIMMIFGFALTAGLFLLLRGRVSPTEAGFLLLPLVEYVVGGDVADRAVEADAVVVVDVASDDALGVLDVYPFPVVGLEHDGRVPGVLVVGLLVVERERRQDDPDADLVPPVDPKVGVVPVREVVEELPGRRFQTLLLEDDRRIPEPRRELQRVDAARVHDGVDVDAADVALVGEPALQAAERAVEQAVALRPEHRGPHLARRGTDVPGEQFLVLAKVAYIMDFKI